MEYIAEAEKGALENTTVNEWVNERVNTIEADAIEEFSKEFALNPTDIRYYVENYDPEKERSEQIGEEGIISSSDYSSYQTNNPGSTPLKYKRKVRESLPEFVEDQILPFRVK